LARWRSITDGPLLVLAIGTLPFLLLELARLELPRSDTLLIDIVNYVVLVAFSVDYLVELRLADGRRMYMRREWTSLLIVVSQVIAVVPGFQAIGLLRALRGVRGMRAALVVLRLVAIGGATAHEGRAYLRKHAAGLALGVAGFTWLTSAAAFTIAEDVGVNGRIHSFYDALWWSTATITTVGYGDVAPITAAGRIIGAFTMVVGISTFAVVTAKVAEFLVRGHVRPDAPDERPS
jgi:voltage-gated potassium channel